jgi:hypothetical protein
MRLARRLDGVVVSVLATGPSGRGFKPGPGDEFFLGLFLTTEVFLNHSGFLDHIQLTHTVGLLWMSYQPVVHALSGIRTGREPSGRRPTPYTVRQPKSARWIFKVDKNPQHTFLRMGSEAGGAMS